MDSFLKIAITQEEFLPDEAVLIQKVIEAGIDMVHIRKPGSTMESLRILLDDIEPEYYGRLKLHDHFQLLLEYDLGGVHLNSRNPRAPEGARAISRSCHSLEELVDTSHYDYVTLSPIFDSISKKGYVAAFDLSSLTDKVFNKSVIALGGVTPEKIPLLRQTGFAGAAMLGCVWRNTDEFCKQIKTF